MVASALAAACGAKPAREPPAAPAAAATVRVTAVTRGNLAETVSATGHTAAQAQQKVRAPFPGTLTELRVADGDRVRRGDVVGTVVSRDSEAALAGAREMARQANTAAEKRDADRAVALAEHGLVRAPLYATAGGSILAHAAASGDRVGEGQEILTIADASSLAFIADVSQSDLPRVRAGQSAAVELAGRPRSVGGVVHAVLPGANAADFTLPVRIDLKGLEEIGLFGTARITVGERRAATLVPDAALLRDDVTGRTRLAVVREGKAHWVAVTTGAHGAGVTEVLSPALSEAEPIIVAGQVGLPEGAAVQVRP